MIREITNMNEIHDEIWDLLPWYVNGSIDNAERAVIEEHLKTCEVCQKEVSNQKRLASVLSERRDLDAIEDANWARISEKIDLNAQLDDENEKAAQPIDFAAERAKRHPAKPWLYPALMAACLTVAVFAASDTQWVQSDSFRTLTNDNPAASAGNELIEASLRIKAADNISHSTMADLLSKHDLTIVDGPSPTGVYTVTSTHDDTLDRAFSAMQSADEVVFVSRLEGN